VIVRESAAIPSSGSRLMSMTVAGATTPAFHNASRSVPPAMNAASPAAAAQAARASAIRR
jgi:hypothetical protein